METPTEAGESAESFATYLAHSLAVETGAQIGTVDEAAEIADHSDIIITLLDGYTVEITAIIDCERNPGKIFALDRTALDRIGKHCRQYAGTVSGSKMPVRIRIFEVGPEVDSPVRRARLRELTSSFFGKVNVTFWLIDTVTKTVVTNAFLNGRFRGRPAIERLLREPRRERAPSPTPEPVAEAPETTPYLTYGLLAILIAVFAGEILFGIGDFGGLLEPSITTLTVMGGISPPAVLEGNEWHRLIAATFLHADLVHIALNGIVLFFVGRALEQIVGHAWFAAIYAVSALCGAFLSLVTLAPNIVSVGASGAIMGLLGAIFVTSFRYPKGPTRLQMQLLAAQVLIPSLIPLGQSGQHIDIAAHIGGMLGGAAVGIIMLALWSRRSPLPKLQTIAAAVAAAWISAAFWSLHPITQTYAKHQHDLYLQALLMPDNEPARDPEELVKLYPRDPRARQHRAMDYLHRNELGKAAEELRRALDEEEILRAYFPASFENELRARLAFILLEAGKLDEAKQAAKPACGHFKADNELIRQSFQRLCE